MGQNESIINDSGGGVVSGNQGKINAQIEADRQKALQNQQQVFQLASTPSAAQKRFDSQSAAWDEWVKGKDYSHGPEGSLLDFSLWNPAHTAAQSAKMENITGTGATALGGNDSVALQLAKHHSADTAAQNAGQSYENAVQGQDAYFKNSNLPYMQAENAKWGNLFGQTSSNVNNLTDNYQRSATQSMWPSIIGGGLSAAGGFLGGPLAAAKL